MSPLKNHTTITINNKKYAYSITKKKNNIVYVECEAAKIAQDFPAEDLADLLIDLPNLIMAEKQHQERQSNIIRFRVSTSDKKKIEKKAIEKGYESVSEYLRNLALSAQ